MSGHRVIPHPADVALEAWGPTLPDALREAVAALAAIETSGAPPAPTGGTHSAVLDATSPESLLVGLLEECLYLIDAHGWLATGATVSVSGDQAHAVLEGAPWDGGADGVHVKAVTWHHLRVTTDGERVTAHALLDL